MGSEHSDRRVVEYSEVPGCQQDPEFGGAKSPMRQVELSHGVGGEVALDREHQESDQHSYGDSWFYKARKGEAAHQEQGRDGVGDMVNVEAIARPLAVAKARQRSVQAVAQPIHTEAENAQEERRGIPACKRVADSRHA